ncbi:uncharacterized protein M6B38_249675 [Iris pallida]|uniref:Uncharacterized protein n=1 Tax=Iris pallida TaxID=29817 RepID=A0AAX6IKE5_IRIPA|nr:uncharacterized protein M6B38_249675 [Iris pallida]
MDPAKCKRNRPRPDVEALAKSRIGPYLRLIIYLYFYYLISIYIYLIFQFRTNGCLSYFNLCK